HSARELYALVERHGGGIRELIHVTPQRSDALILLSDYLAGKGEPAKEELSKLIEALVRMPLEPLQRLAVAQHALKADFPDVARAQALLASQSTESRLDALRVLAEIAWHKGEWTEFEAWSQKVEKAQRELGTTERAAESALAAAMRLASVESRGKTRERFVRILKEYPAYAPVYFQMAMFSQNDSQQLALYYLKKAVELAPGHLDYRNHLAQHYISLSQITEAEKIYEEFLQTPEFQTTGYLGLARCKFLRGDPLQTISILEEGIHKAGKSEQLFYQLGRMYDAIGDYRKAAQAYLEYAALTPGKIDGYNLAGDAYQNLGDYAAARAQYNRSLTKNPQNRHALNSLLLLDSIGR
ncbi:MAG: tetratricopeptide repeat protein, partial [Nitrososphaera sp.]|nr:tetratricopeptide repeat protein [Nitrososphaera sp.]